MPFIESTAQPPARSRLIEGMVLALLVAVLMAPQTAPVLGRVRDATGLPLGGVVVTLKGTDRFAVTGDDGQFVLAGVETGATLVASRPGFNPQHARVPTDRTTRLEIVLIVGGIRESVAVHAAEPDPPAQSVTTLTALDVVRTPGTQADLMRALLTLPGVSQIDEGTGLFVRGGDVSEVLVVFDGVVVNHPYRYETPTGGFRGAIDPFLTSGASFTTGGFSAEYGNSLSAVLDLRPLGRPQSQQTTVTAGLAGVSASFASPLGSRGGIRAAVNRATPSLLFAVNPSPSEFDRLPGGWDASGSVTAESPRLGSLRVTGLSQRDHVGVELEKDAFVGFLHSDTRHELIAAKWQRAAGPRWLATISIGGDRFTKSTDVGVLRLDELESHRSARAELTGGGGPWHTLVGVDSDVVDTDILGHVPERGGDFGGISGSERFEIAHRDWRAGVFGVASRSAGPFTVEAGLRADRFDAGSEMTVDPRASVRIDVGGERSVRVAIGRYHQAPSPAYFDRVRGAQVLSAMSATHLVLGYERGTPAGRTFGRIELYKKWYDNLPFEDDAGFSSDGYGNSAGADVYLHRVWSGLDLTLGGSVLHARRRWTPAEQRDRYTTPAGTWSPDFEIPYSFQAIARIPISRMFNLAGSWRTAAGRPFTPAIGAVQTDTGDEPIWAPINSDRLPRYERVDLSISALTTIGQRATAVFFASVDNLIGRRNVFEMAYSADYSARRPVKSASPRAFYVGCSISITR
jgi:Carboxypeptidase regulatory-like domain/TonB-dependent Receptor Plug Domain